MAKSLFRRHFHLTFLFESKTPLLLGGLLSLCLVSFAPASQQDGKFVPPEGKVLLVMGQDIQNLKDYVNSIRTIPAGFSVYTSIEYLDGLDSPVDHGGGLQHADALVEKFPNSVIQMGLYMVDSLEKVYAGDLDENLDKLGDWIATVQRPVYLRIGYEFDLPENNYDPEEYVLAYRYIVDYLRGMCVSNSAYVWHSYASQMQRPHMDCYPGDDYVDWVAISYFRQEKRHMNPVAELAEKRGKPFMIAESSPWKMPTYFGKKTWDEWFVPLMEFVEEKEVKMLCYINCQWDEMPLFRSQQWGDARIQSDKDLTRLWLKEITKDKYLKPTPALSSQLGYQK